MSRVYSTGSIVSSADNSIAIPSVKRHHSKFCLALGLQLKGKALVYVSGVEGIAVGMAPRLTWSSIEIAIGKSFFQLQLNAFLIGDLPLYWDSSIGKSI